MIAKIPIQTVSKSVPSEHEEAKALMRLVHLHEAQHPELRWFAAIPNGGARSKATAGKLKAEGVRKGVPDYLMPVSMSVKDGDVVGLYREYIGLAIELKRRKGGRVEPEQHDWMAHLSEQGWRCHVASGHEVAWAAICEYLGIRNVLEGGA